MTPFEAQEMINGPTAQRGGSGEVCIPVWRNYGFWIDDALEMR